MPAPSHRICLSLNLGWGYGGGFYFGISAGVGLEGGAYAGISIGYNTSGSFSFSASAGIAGFYVSGGYDTKGGWNASAGWSAPLPSFGIVSFNTNLTSLGVNYSQNGGLSGNNMGMQISQSGMSFSPSVGVGLELLQYYPKNKSIVSSQNGSERTTEGEYGHIDLFEDETVGYKYMYLFSKVDDVEYGALIAKDGLLVSRYGTDGTENIWQGRSHVIMLGKHYIKWSGKMTRIYGHIHVHQNPDANYFSYFAEGGNDRATQLSNKNMLFYLMCMDEMGSFYSARASNKEEGVILQPLRGLGGYTVKSLLDGTLKLIPYSINYKY